MNRFGIAPQAAVLGVSVAALRRLAREIFLPFLEAVEREAADDRNYVRKAESWALRKIGKRSRTLRRHAIATAKRINTIDSTAARWIASDVLRELQKAPARRCR